MRDGLLPRRAHGAPAGHPAVDDQDGRGGALMTAAPPGSGSPCASTAAASVRRRPVVDHEDEHAAGALGRVGDLDVVDADAGVGGQGGDLGQHARPGRARGCAARPGGRAGRCGPAGCAGPRWPTAARRAARPRSCGGHAGAHRRCRSLDESVEGVDDGGGVLRADVGPDARDARPPPGSCRGSRRRPAGAARRPARPRRWPRSSGWRPPGAGRGRPRRPGGRGRRRRATRTSAPRLMTTHLSRSKEARSVAAVGVSTQTAPSKRSGSAPCSPICSDPAMGWPPMKRGWSASSTMAVLTPLTSVTTASAGARRPRGRAATPATAVAGVATKTTSASGSSPTASTTSPAERLGAPGPRRRRGPRRASPAGAGRGRWSRRSARSRPRAPGGAPARQSGRSSRSPWAPCR